MSALYWMQDDALVVPESCEDLPALFVFDDETIRYRRYGLKRIGFIYETLLTLPVEIWRGETENVLLEACKRAGATELVTVTSACPRFQAILSNLKPHLTLRLIEPTPFVVPQKRLDLKRFSRYWRKVEKQALEPTSSLL